MKKIILTLAILLSIVGFQGIALAVVEDVDCFQYYKFGGIEFNELYPEKVSYSPGDKVKVSYELNNLLGHPVVHGEVKAQVLYRGLKDIDRTEGDDIIDEFFVVRDLNLKANDTYSDEFEWLVPKNAKSGVYVVNLYFLVKDKFSLSGLSFMTSVPGRTTTFEVVNPNGYRISFDKNNTFINDKRYLFRASTPSFDPGTLVKIKTELLNEGEQENIRIRYDLYLWDDIDESSRIDRFTKEETINVPKGLKSIEYALADLPAGVYVARFTATSGDTKSILKVRFLMKGVKGKIIYLGLDHFPLLKGDNTTVFFCIENSAAHAGDLSARFVGRGNVRIIDSEGNLILDESYGPENVTPIIEGKKIEFTYPKDMRKLTLKADLYDDKGILMDDVELIYDYSKFLNIKRNFELTTLKDGKESSTFLIGDPISWVLRYEDEFKDPIDGEVIIYLVAPDGKVVHMDKKAIHGALDGLIRTDGLDGGEYELKAIEPKEHLKTVKLINIAGRTTTTTISVTTTMEEIKPEREAPGYLWLIGIAMVIIIIAVMIWGRKR